MKFGHAILFFLVVILVAYGFFFFYSQHQAAENKILLQSLDCHSEKIDASITSLDAKTKVVGALVAFERTPINKTLRHKIEDLDIVIDDANWVLDYGRMEIPTKSLCELVQFSEVTKIFIPTQQYGITVNK